MTVKATRMQSDRIRLHHLAVASAEDLKRLPLEVAVLQNDLEMAETWADLMSIATSWRVTPLESLEHAVHYLERRLPHVLIIHWHRGSDHEHANPVTDLVHRLKRRRQQPGIGAGPFLAGTYWHDSDYYRDPTFMPFIERTYDCTIDLAEVGSDPLDTLTRELWARLPAPPAPGTPPRD